MSRAAPKVPKVPKAPEHTTQEAEANLRAENIQAHHFGTNDPGAHPPNAKTTNRQEEYTQNKNKRDAFGKMASLAALGITLAVAVKIAGDSMNHWLATNGATIKFTSIVSDSPFPSWLPEFFMNFLRKFIKSKNLRISYTVTAAGTDNNAIPDVLAKKTDVRLTKYDTISVDPGTTGLSYLDGQTIEVARVVSQGVFIYKGSEDTSNVSVYNKGTGTINSSYDEQLGESTAETASDISSIISRTVGPIFDNFGTIVFYIVFALVLYFFFQLVSSLR